MTENASAERNRRTPSKAAPLATVRAKDHLSMAVVLSVASLAWFGWGHQGAQIVWWLRAGMVASGIALVIATILVRRIPVRPTLATDPGARKVYWIAVVAEVVLILAGMFVLPRTGNSAYVSTWVLFVVGIHFLPFVRPFNAPTLRYTALACIVVAAVTLWAGLAGWAPAPTVAGAGGGIVLLGFAFFLMSEARVGRGSTA